MMSAAIPFNEKDRLHALVELEIMDTAPEKEFDDIVQLASQICETPMSLITLLEEKRLWFKAKVGIDGTESTRDLSFCSHVILHDDMMVVENALEDNRFFDNPSVTGDPNVRFYAGMPLTTTDGFKLGSLCVVDSVPRRLTPLQKNALQILSSQVIKLLETRIARRKIEDQAQALQKMNETNAKLLSIIGHDLRSPLANLKQIIDLNSGGDLSPTEALELIGEVGTSVNESISLLDNLMAWASEQFKNEQVLVRSINVTVLLQEIVDSFAAKTDVKANRVLITTDLQKKVLNENVLRLLVRNLIANANKFTTGGTIEITARMVDNNIKVSVIDSGTGMTAEQVAELYDWDKRLRTTGTSGERGSGIGLKLCKEMVEDAGGNLHVESNPGKGTVFSFTLPVG